MAEVSLENTETFLLPRDGLPDLRISVAVPDAELPEDGWPVLFVLDADDDFATARGIAGSLAAWPEVWNVRPMLVVGLGYARGTDVASARIGDYSPPATPDRLPARPDGTPWPRHGGADDFLDLIEGEVRPLLARHWRIDTGRMALFGHSFGGLLTLHAALTRPASFGAFLISSPSIWFADRVVLDGLAGFDDRLAAAGPRRMMLSVGGDEQDLPGWAQEAAGARYLAWLRGNRMVDNLRDVAGRLEGTPGLDLRLHVFEGEHHGSSPPLALNKAIRFAFAVR